MNYLRIAHTFRNGLQYETDRRYRHFMVTDVLFDRLLVDVLEVNAPIFAKLDDGFSIFQALMDCSQEGEWLKGATVWAFGFDLEKGCWMALIKHASFNPVPEGGLIPT